MGNNNHEGKTRFEQVPLEVVREAIMRGKIRDVQHAESLPETEPETMGELKYPEWQEPFRQALLESDREELKEQLMAVETVILKRLDSIADDSAFRDEQQAIHDALSTIRILKRETA